jgi:hypothetical protein
MMEFSILFENAAYPEERLQALEGCAHSLVGVNLFKVITVVMAKQMAEREGFEPPEGLHPLRFSRPSQ